MEKFKKIRNQFNMFKNLFSTTKIILIFKNMKKIYNNVYIIFTNKFKTSLKIFTQLNRELSRLQNIQFKIINQILINHQK